MKKKILILTFVTGITIASESQVQPCKFKHALNQIPQNVKTGTSLLASGISASASTAATTFLALNTKYFLEKALFFSTNWSYKKDYAAETPLSCGTAMFYGLGTITFGALTIYLLNHFTKKLNFILNSLPPATTEPETQIS